LHLKKFSQKQSILEKNVSYKGFVISEEI